MAKPNSQLHNPDPAYLRRLIARAGITQREAAQRLGISERVLRRYLADRDTPSALAAPYIVQFALESLAHGIDDE